MAVSVKVHKTKEDLLNEVEELKDVLKEKEKEIEALERYKQYERTADELRAMHMGFVKAGFTDDQAFEMTKNIMTFGLKFIQHTI